MITTNEQFENFIENEDDWFSDIETKVLDLENEISEWRESRTRELTQSPPRRDREMLRAQGNAGRAGNYGRTSAGRRRAGSAILGPHFSPGQPMTTPAGCRTGQ